MTDEYATVPAVDDESDDAPNSLAEIVRGIIGECEGDEIKRELNTTYARKRAQMETGTTPGGGLTVEWVQHDEVDFDEVDIDADELAESLEAEHDNE
jgi:hypothetical protein